MTKLLIALGLTLAASTAAFADSSALDSYDFPAYMGSGMVDYTSTASIGYGGFMELGPHMGDSVPAFAATTGSIDYAPTASIGYSTGPDTYNVSPRAL